MSDFPEQPRVFVVDDESIIATTLATILQKSGYNAIPYTSPIKALSEARLDPPALLITDVMMPKLSGIDLAIAVREFHPSCKVLLFSGQAATANMLQESQAKGYSFELISKPIHPTELLKKIRMITEEQVA